MPKKKPRRTFVTIGFTPGEIKKLRNYSGACNVALEDAIGDLALQCLKLKGAALREAYGEHPSPTVRALSTPAKRPPCASSYCSWPEPCGGCNSNAQTPDREDMCPGERLAHGYR